jgi:hypothetical protein
MEQATTTSTEVPVFYCTCNGCRQVPKDYHRTSTAGILAELNGHFFSPSTMKFFGSRVTGFRVLYSVGGVVITSTQRAGFNDSDGREYSLAYFCKFGNLVDAFRFPNSATVRKELQAQRVEIISACPCHGCQIERARTGA